MTQEAKKNRSKWESEIRSGFEQMFATLSSEATALRAENKELCSSAKDRFEAYCLDFEEQMLKEFEIAVAQRHCSVCGQGGSPSGDEVQLLQKSMETNNSYTHGSFNISLKQKKKGRVESPGTTLKATVRGAVVVTQPANRYDSGGNFHFSSTSPTSQQQNVISRRTPQKQQQRRIIKNQKLPPS